jgi:hypothetical protein
MTFHTWLKSLGTSKPLSSRSSAATRLPAEDVRSGLCHKVAAHATQLLRSVVTRQMPPWHIDRSVGVQKFKNDMSLTDEQVNTIARWVDGGALEGDPKDLPPPKALVTDNEWKAVRDGFGPPDLVIQSPKFTMPA